MKRFLLTFSILLSVVLQLAAQTTPPSNLSGDDLKTWLRTNWYDGKRVVLDYGTARGKMYNYIDNYDNKVTCVYSGYQVSKTYSETNTSTTDVGLINCEHTVPQSWFNEAVRMRTDIHHLFPTHSTWNSDRGSDPFAEIPDNQTTKWIRGTTSQSAIPTSNIDEYSEDTNSQFEPREDHKGNLARSVFYFYTMHTGQTFDPGKGVISAVADINTLYQWHLQDPVDDRERERNRRTEIAQGNRNPYIDYPELVAKAWGFAAANCSPNTQLSNLTISQKTTSTVTLNWTNGSGDRRFIVIKEGSAVSLSPTGTYTGINSDYSVATDQGNGNRIIYYNNGAGVTITGLKANTTYYVQAFESCASDKSFNTASAPTIAVTTPDYACTGVPTAVTGMTSDNITQGGFRLSWINGSGDGRVIVIRKDAAGTFVPQAGTAYTGASANYTTAAPLADGSRLIYNGAGSEVNVTGLQAGSLYFVQVFEACSNGNLYETNTAPMLAVTTAAANNPPTGNGNVIAMQDFNGTANDGWVVTSGFSSSNVNTGLPNGQRLRSGSSLQTAAIARDVIFSDVNVSGKQDLYLELYNSSVSGSDGNGFDAGDYLEVYVALDGANFSATPDIRITGSTSTNQIRYGMTGTATITTPAGTPVEKIFTESLVSGVVLADDKAPSKLQVTIPNGSASVKVKLAIKTNAANEIWNIDDVALFAAAASADCDELVLEGHAGEDKTLYTNQSATIGAAAVTGYIYNWSPAVGLSSATVANPTVSLTTPGTYVYTVTATKDGCTSTDDVAITVKSMAPPTVADVAICDGESATLSVITPDAAMVYKWYNTETAGNLLATGTTYTTAALTSTTVYYVEAVNNAGVASARTKVTVMVGSPVAATIAGPDRVCEGETVTYTVVAQNGIMNYSWTIPANWTIISGTGTKQITVKAANNNGQIGVVATNNCGQSKVTVIGVNVSVPVTNNSISAPQSICAGQVAATITGSIPAGGTGNYIYLWQTSTDGVNFVPAAYTNNQANYTPAQLTNTTFIRRTIISGSCGQSISEAIKISVNPAPAKPVITQTANQLSASVTGSMYEWKKDGVVVANATKQNITITEAGNYTVRVQSEAGCYSELSEVFQATLQPTAIGDELATGIVLAPNPTRGKIVIATIEPLQHVEVIITNSMGSVVYRTSASAIQSQMEVDLSKLPAGLYMVQLQSKKLRIVRKVILTK